MARSDPIGSSEWPEVRFINGYAVFIGYLMMGVRGLGLLVVTWTTVVLLGGFVSVLEKKDFWCLTGITLVQTSGVFNFLLKDKLSDIVRLSWGLLGAVQATVSRPYRKGKTRDISASRLLLAFGLSALQLLVFAVILCPLAILYVFGLYISAGVSIWRLIEQDFGNAADGGANLKSALQVLYGLAVAQGVLFGYKTIHAFAATIGLAESVAGICLVDKELVSDYLNETVAGCEKDPSFATGRNLVTYAVYLMESSKTNDSYLIGVRILGTILHRDYLRFSGQLVLIKQLLTGSASFGHAVQRLLETFGPRSPYSGDIREHAARILAHVAGSICLGEQFPGGRMVQCVSSLLDTTFEEYSWRPEGYQRHSDLSKEYERDWLLEEHERYLAHDIPSPRAGKSTEGDSNSTLHAYSELVVQGLLILQKLAIDEDNCRIISNTQGLLTKTMRPLISDHLHEDRHDEWSSIAEESMELMSRLMAAPGDTGSKLRSEISGSGQAAIVANDILECSKCGVLLKRQAVKVLLDLPGDMSSSGRNSTIFVGLLLHISLLPDYCFEADLFSPIGHGTYYSKMRGSTHLAKRSSYITRLAGEKLQCPVLSLQNEAGTKSMSLQPSVAAAVADLTRTSADAAVNITCRLHVVQILEDLCRRYTKDDQYLQELKNAMADVMPKVLREIVGCVLTSAEIHAKTEAKNDQVSTQRTDDMEKGVVPQGNGQEDASSSQQQKGEKQDESIRLQEALLSLCEAIFLKWDHQFDDLAEKTCLEQGISIPHKDFMIFVSYARRLLDEQKKAQRIGD